MVRILPETLSDLWEMLNYPDRKEYLGVSRFMKGFTGDHFAG